jgi:hypothetical protein
MEDKLTMLAAQGDQQMAIASFKKDLDRKYHTPKISPFKTADG